MKIAAKVGGPNSVKLPGGSTHETTARKLPTVTSELLIAAMVATIRAEWTCVDTWYTHARSFNGMPTGDEFTSLVAALFEFERLNQH